MDFDRPPSRPIVKSSVSAQAEWESWLVQNNFEYLRDADGLDWQVLMSFEQLPSTSNPRMGRWVTCLQIGLDTPISALVNTGTFDADHDSRLIQLAGQRMIPLRMRKVQYEANSESDMRDVLARALPELRENFRKTSLHQVKRNLVGRWLDGRMVFGEETLETPKPVEKTTH